MKLFYIDGKKAGEAYLLVPPGISIGREIDNDLILDSEGCSRYHAKLEWTDDGWKIKDLGSTNGSKINGERISGTLPLKEGDKIKIGTQTLLFAENPLPGTPEPAKTAEPSSGKELHAGHSNPTITEMSKENIGNAAAMQSFSDFFGKKSEDGSFSGIDAKTNIFGSKDKKSESQPQGEGHKRKSPVIFASIVILSAIILISIFVLLEKIQAEKKQNASSAQPQKNIGAPLTVLYEKQITTPDNIFRYELRICGEKISVTRDDLKCHVRFFREKQIPPEQLHDIEEGIKNTDFMNIEQPQAGISGDNTDEAKTLTVAFGKQMNSIRIKNTFEPTSFKEVVSQIEDFSKVMLNIPPVQLTAEEMTEEARIAFDKAEQLFENYQADKKNLTNAIKRYQIAIDMLQYFEPKPEMYEKAFARQQEAKRIRKEQLDGHDKNASQFLHLNELDKARSEYRQIMDMMDEDSKAYQEARDRVIKIEKILAGHKK